ncbi:uncharacterized protein B0I36DRAFT_153720 [Microdochium trichocladiopsis]|uniref:Uncharacterized protein n=1 Tax=Microdochium trichocladiopsis TaxID=1682393 RepID=A0A9P8Y2Q9_9PEZI|nr:uncharacterized protein B0I36DRAFT_153720 [Microdochium trichocladiopsis]KAH7026093.1 hypothetical protein B0I36DRAFT_153720 [Microdochium trichocladiopsis]
MAALMHHYLDPDTAVFFIHDCSDEWPDRLEFSVELLHLHVRQMMDKKARHLWVLLGKQDAIIPGDDDDDDEVRRRKGRDKVDELKGRFERELARYDHGRGEKGGEGGSGGGDGGDGQDGIFYRILAPEGLSGVSGAGLPVVMDDVCSTLSRAAEVRRDEAGGLQKGSENKKTPPDTAARAKGAPHEQPLSQEELQALAAEEMSSIQPAHVFWREFLDGTLPAWNHASHLQAGYLVLLECLTSGKGVFESADAFLQHLARLRDRQPDRFRNTAHVTMTVFWLLQLHLAAVNLQIATSQELFPSKEQFREVVLHSPSLMDRGLWKIYYSKDLLFSPAAREQWHLPDLCPLPSMTATRNAEEPPVSAATHRTVGNDRLVEYAFAVVKKTLAENLRRGAVVKQALASLQRTTLQFRAKDSSIPQYSETQAYFWIQIVHAALHSFAQDTTGRNAEQQQHQVENSEVPVTRMQDISLINLNFPAFKLLYDLNGDATWREYYTARLWQDDVSARMQFAPPDLKPLPSVIKAEDKSVLAAHDMLFQTAAAQLVSTEHLPSREVLAFLADCLVEEIKQTDTTTSVVGKTDSQVTSPIKVQSHAQLISHLHTHLILATSGQGGNEKTSVQELPLSSSRAAGTLDGFVLGEHDSYTEKSFWTRQVLLAAAAGDTTSLGSVEHLIRAHPQLAYERLPFLDYSPALWYSAEARAGFVPPDRRGSGVVGAVAGEAA